MEMTTVKTIAVFAIIFGCFAVLYPKIFHPMLASLVGGGRRDDHTDNVATNRIPPHLRKTGATHKMPGGSADEEISKFMRAGPHPGMRAAAEMKKQAAAQGGGSGKGMMSVVLPMYAVGIVIYLIYTMVKVFGGKKDKEKGDFLNNHFNDIHYDAETKKFRHRAEDSMPGMAEEEEEVDEEETIAKKFKKGRKDLERLLLKADKNNISSMEMNELKRRLLETEAQMARILGALESVEGQVGAAGSAGLRAAKARPDGDTAGDEQGEWEDEENTEKQTRPVDSSPDMDSYEIISGKTSPKSGSRSPDSNKSQSPIIEDIGPEFNDNDNDNRLDGSSQDDIPHKHAKCKEEEEDGRAGDDDREGDAFVDELMPEKKSDEDDDQHPDLRKRTKNVTDQDN